MCKACDRAEQLKEDGLCVECGGELKPTGEEITISAGLLVFICDQCGVMYHVAQSVGVIPHRKVLQDFPTLHQKWNQFLKENEDG